MAAAAPLEFDLKIRYLPLCLLATWSMNAAAELNIFVVEGLGGDPQYGERFAAEVSAIQKAAATVTAPARIKILRGDAATRDAVLAWFDALKSATRADDQLIVYLVGHGSFDDVEYKFNLPGPDLTGADIAGALDALPTTHQVLVNTSSSSGATLDLLKKDDRIVITATRSGAERHATRFGGYFVAALSDPGADLDKNRLISTEEAFDFAERQVGDYFDGNGQLATEHARLEGNSAARVTLARLDAPKPAAEDRQLQELLGRRDALNAEIESLRATRDDLSDEAYRSELLQKMLELAQTEDSIEAREAELEQQ